MPFCFGSKQAKNKNKVSDGRTDEKKQPEATAKPDSKAQSKDSSGAAASSSTASGGKKDSSKNKMPADKVSSIPPLSAADDKSQKDLLANQKDETYLIYHSEEGVEYKTYLSGGVRYVFDEDLGDWAEMPDEWLTKGRFEPLTLFERWISPDGEELMTFFNDDGVRVYVDFESGEEVPFPAEWETQGQFIPDDGSGYEEDEGPQISTFEAPDGNTYTICVVPEEVMVRYYHDEQMDTWVKFPREWERSLNSSFGGNSRPGTSMGNRADEEDEQFAAIKRSETQATMEKQVEIEALKKKVRKLEDEVFQFKSSGAKTGGSDREAKLERDAQRFKDAGRKIKKELDALKASHETLKKQMREKLASMAEASQSVVAAGPGDEGLKKRLKEKEDAYAELETKYSEVVEKLAAKESEASSGQEHVEGTVKAVQGKIAGMRPEIEQIRQEIVQARSEIMPGLDKLYDVTRNFLTSQAKSDDELRAKYRKEVLLRKSLYNQIQELKGNIRVYCRVRTMSQKELGEGDHVAIETPKDMGEVHFTHNGTKKVFEFEQVYGMSSTQEQVFEDTQPLITSCIDGYNVCIFAYGQTGSGKTWTMMGPADNRGVNYRALNELFKVTKERDENTYTITVSFIEIYNEQIRDLLPEKIDPSRKYEIRMGPRGNYVPDLVEMPVNSTEDVDKVMDKGNSNRTTAATKMNSSSSRSHSLVLIKVVGKNKLNGAETSGQLTMVDLAGSERLSRTGAKGQQVVEAAAINKSLSALGNVISGLQAGQSHIPYRNSKLTHLLESSLGGDSKTLMFVNLSPAGANLDESLNSLQFAARVGKVTNDVPGKGKGKSKGKGKAKMPPTPK